MPISTDMLGVSANLGEASTLASDCYLDEAFYRKEKEAIFARTWQLVGRMEQVAKPGEYFTAEVAGEPVVLVRGMDGVLRGFVNVCRHRASLVATGSGNCNKLRCPYHGWTYDLTGSLIGMPEFDGVQDFARETIHLPSVAVENWGPFLFVNLEKTPTPLSEVLGQIPNDIQASGFSMEDYKFLARRDYVVECNWKVYVDNYLEGYHIPVAHPDLFKEIDYRAYRVDTFRYYSFQHAPMRSKKDDSERRYDPAKGDSDALYYWIFPNLMVNIYPDNMSTNLIIPLGAHRTLTIFEWFVPPNRLVEGVEAMEATISFSDQVQKEDIVICERVQKGLGSRSYNRGRYSVKRENGVHHFHRLVQEFLSAR